jgi:hypothetical protein
MIFSENRFPLFRIMLYTTRAQGGLARFQGFTIQGLAGRAI